MSQELWVIFIFGLTFLITRVILAVRVPIPTRDQEAVFRTVLSLSAAGIAAAIPGLLKLDSQAAATTISATGALAVFAMVYLFNPASTSGGRFRFQDSDTKVPKGADTDSLVQQFQQLLAEVRTLSTRVQELEEHMTGNDHAAPRTQYRVRFVSTVVLSMVVLFLPTVVSVFLRNPTVAQFEITRTVMALAGAAIAATIPGTLGVTASGSRMILRLTVALVMFVIIYSVTPTPYITIVK